jgi:chitodextrinase
VRFPRAAIAGGLALFLVLAGAGVATAVWTASSPLSSTVNSGRLAVTITPADVAKLNATYSPSVLSDTAAVSVTNSGTVPANYTVQVKAASTGLSNSTTLTGWIVTSAAQCTATSPVGAQSGSAVLSTGLSTADSVAVGAVDIFCIRTTIPASYATTVGPASVPTVVLNYSQGTWNGSSSATATQTVADTVAPSAPGTPAESGTTAAKTTLTWAASTDNLAVTGYDVYRNGTLAGTVSAPTVAFTDSGLTGGTTYNYTVKARDAAGNVSAASAARSVTTATFDTSVNYQVKFTAANLCIDGGVSPGAQGNNLVTLACQTGRSQTWQFAASGAHYKIFSAATPTLVWDISGGSTTDGSSAITWGWSGSNNQLWTITSEGNGKVHVASVNSGKCLTLKSNTAGSQVQQYTCDGTATQTFTLTQVP